MRPEAKRLHSIASDYLTAMRLLFDAESALTKLLPGVPREILLELVHDLADPEKGLERAEAVLDVINRNQAAGTKGKASAASREAPDVNPEPESAPETESVPDVISEPETAVEGGSDETTEQVLFEREATVAEPAIELDVDVAPFLAPRSEFHLKELAKFVITSGGPPESVQEATKQISDVLVSMRSLKLIDKDPNSDWGWIVVRVP